MPTIAMSDSSKSCSITLSSEMAYEAEVLHELMDDIAAMHAVVPLVSITVAPLVADPTVYNYRITAADGRLWKQRLKPAASEDECLQTFDVTDAWKLSEFEFHRPIRDGLVYLLTKQGMTNFTLNYT